MKRLPLPYRLLAALLSVTMLASVALPAVQHACAAMAMADTPGHHDASPSGTSLADDVVMSHAAMGHAAMGSHQTDDDAVSPDATPVPAEAAPSAAPCLDPCPSADCCTVEVLPSEAQDFRLPEPTPSPTRVLLQRAAHEAVPAPARAAYAADPVDSLPPVSPVRLHVWTETFLK